MSSAQTEKSREGGERNRAIVGHLVSFFVWSDAHPEVVCGGSGLQSYGIRLRRAITTFGYFGVSEVLREFSFVLILFLVLRTVFSTLQNGLARHKKARFLPTHRRSRNVLELYFYLFVLGNGESAEFCATVIRCLRQNVRKK